MKHVTCCDVVLLLLALARVVALAKYICCLSYYLYYDRHSGGTGIDSLDSAFWIQRCGGVFFRHPGYRLQYSEFFAPLLA